MTYAVPNRSGEQTIGTSPVTTYRLTPDELEHLKAGKLDRIPTAAQRGLEPDPEPIKSEETNTSPWRMKRPPQKWGHITREYLLQELKAGKLLSDIARENNIPRGSMFHIVRDRGIVR